MFSNSKTSFVRCAAATVRIATTAVGLAVPIFFAPASDATAQTLAGRMDTELIYLCTRVAHDSVPDSPNNGADHSRNLIYRACMANGGVSVRT